MTTLLLLLISLVMPPCATEDSSACYWDASTRGNGLGQSYWVTADDQVRYLP